MLDHYFVISSALPVHRCFMLTPMRPWVMCKSKTLVQALSFDIKFFLSLLGSRQLAGRCIMWSVCWRPSSCIAFRTLPCLSWIYLKIVATTGASPSTSATMSTTLFTLSPTLARYKCTWHLSHFFSTSMATFQFTWLCETCAHQAPPNGEFQCLQKIHLLFCLILFRAQTMLMNGTPGLLSQSWHNVFPVSTCLMHNFPLKRVLFSDCHLTMFSLLFFAHVAAIFTVAGFYQMAIWALGKHRNYKKEFPDYPRRRKAIVPFLL